ncbi:MAG: fasciclin domain-containing protein [Ilumatobacteraceae bacterium]
MSDNGPDEPTQQHRPDGTDDPVEGEAAAESVPGEPSLFADSPRPPVRPSDATSSLTTGDDPAWGGPPAGAEPDAAAGGPDADDPTPDVAPGEHGGDWMQPEPTAIAPTAPDATAAMGAAGAAGAAGGGAFDPGGPFGGGAGGGGGDDGGGPFDDEPPLDPDEPVPWYRERGPVAALIAGIAAVVMIVIAILVLGGGDDEEVDPAVDTSTTAIETTTTRRRPPRTTTTLPPTTLQPTTTTRRRPPRTTTTLPPTTLPPTTTTAGRRDDDHVADHHDHAAADHDHVAAHHDDAAAHHDDAAADHDHAAADDAATHHHDGTADHRAREPHGLGRAAHQPRPVEGARYIEDADLRDALDDPDRPLTFLAPNNDAFTAVEESPGGPELLGDPDQLQELLLRHIIDQPLSEDDLFSNDELPTAGGDVLEVNQEDRTIEDASVIDGDLGNGGGVVHAIDLVLLP